MKKYVSLFLILFYAVPFTATALEVSGVGFPDSGVWYSNENAQAGETVRIYTLIRNSSDYDIDGTLGFYVDDTFIGSSPFSLAQGHVNHFWTNWTATEGSHAIRIEITESFATLEDGTRESITLPKTTLANDTQKVASAPEPKPLLATNSNNSGTLSFGSAIPTPNTKDKDPRSDNTLVATVKEYTPDSIETIAEETHAKTESFRESQLSNAQLRDQNLKEQFASSTPISVLKEAWSEKDVVTPLQYLWLFGNKLLILILKYAIVFYIVGLYLLYRIIKWIKRKLRGDYY